MKLKDLASRDTPATENLTLRVDKQTMTEIANFRTQYGKKPVAQWLRFALHEAIAKEKSPKKAS